ncbi:MAG TPA: hypothetical protein VIN11_07315 [Roseivirga sp.]
MIKESNDRIELIHGELPSSAAKASINGLIEGMSQQLALEKLRGFENTEDYTQIELLKEQIAQLKLQRAALNERLQLAEQLGCNVQMSISFKLNLSK